MKWLLLCEFYFNYKDIKRGGELRERVAGTSGSQGETLPVAEGGWGRGPGLSGPGDAGGGLGPRHLSSEKGGSQEAESCSVGEKRKRSEEAVVFWEGGSPDGDVLRRTTPPPTHSLAVGNGEASVGRIQAPGPHRNGTRQSGPP